MSSSSSSSLSKSSSSSSSIKWPDLNEEILAEILNRLDLVDFICSTAVCRWWRSVPGKIPRCRPKPEAPWLLIKPPHNDSSFSFYPLTSLNNKSPRRRRLHRYDFHLPQISCGRHFIGSSQGFLITVLNRRSYNISAFNPFTRTHFPIPPPHIFDFDSSESHTYIDCYKCIISPSLDRIIALLYLHGHDFQTLKLVSARPGDASWTPLTIPLNSFEQIDNFIFHKDRLYCFSFDILVAIFDHFDNHSEPRLIPPPEPPLSLLSESIFFVVSPAADDLLRLSRYQVRGEEMRTRFAVFRLDETDFHWEEVRDMGDTAVFCSGDSFSFALSTAEFPSLKRNNIYFTSISYNRPYVNEIGIYDLGDDTIQPLVAADHDDLQKLQHWMPTWFHPPSYSFF